MTRVRTVGVVIAALAVMAVGVLALGRPASADRPLPRFSAPPLRPVDPQLDDQTVRGRPAVLIFWASWCEPCQREIPAIVARSPLGSDRVRIIGVDTNDRRDDAIAFLADHASQALPTAFDDTGSVAEALGLYGLPATVYISADGTIAATHVGPTSPDDVAHFVAEASR